MSAIPSFTVLCDGTPAGRSCDADSPNADLGNRTAADARREARAQGWAQRGGRDYCPRCQDEGQMAAHEARLQLLRRSRRRG